MILADQGCLVSSDFAIMHIFYYATVAAANGIVANKDRSSNHRFEPLGLPFGFVTIGLDKFVGSSILEDY
jgi:hypothetical protein